MKPIKMYRCNKDSLPSNHENWNHQDNVIKDILFTSGNESWVGYFKLSTEGNLMTLEDYYFVDYQSLEKSKIEDIEFWGIIEYES